MHRTHIDRFFHPGHDVLLRSLKYLLLVALTAAVAIELSPGALALLALGVGLAVAFAERVRKLGHPGSTVQSEAPSGLPLADGGCFPGGRPVRGQVATGKTVVLDGGSLGHRRSSQA